MIELERLEEEMYERVERLVKNYWNLNKCCVYLELARDTKTDDAAINDEQIVDVELNSSWHSKCGKGSLLSLKWVLWYKLIWM